MTEPTLQSLRAQGFHLHDPARFHYLEVLARRLQTQPATVQQVLARRLSASVRAYAERAEAALAAPALGSPPGAAAAPVPPHGCALAQLNREIRARAEVDADGVRLGDGDSVSDLKSVRQFSEVWSRIAADRQVVQALHRAPDNAGPLNSHKLVLRTLSLMRALSPDYLRGFLAQVDSLLWLQEAATKPVRPAVRPARAGRAKP